MFGNLKRETIIGLCLVLVGLMLPLVPTQLNLVAITAASGSATDIQIAVDDVAALGGGTVYVPEGDFVFNPIEYGAVKVPGGVNIIGAGKEKTILRNIAPVPYYDWAWGWFFKVDGSGEGGASMHLSGFSIIGFRELYPDHDARTNGIEIRQVKDFVISDIKIKDVGGVGISSLGWQSYGSVPTQGVICDCDFINTSGEPMGPGAIASGPNVLGYGVLVQGRGGESDWIDDITQVLGKYDYGQPVVYVEDCYFSKWRHSIASNQVGHYVARHNTFENCNGCGDIDNHGAGYGTSGTGTRAVEVYDNLFLSPTPTGSWTMATVYCRGGGGVYFNNNVRSGWKRFVYFTNDGTWWVPIEEVEKYFINNVWIWNNEVASDVILTAKYDPDGIIIEGVNYYLNEPAFSYQPYPYPHPLTLGEDPYVPPESEDTTGVLQVYASYDEEAIVAGVSVNDVYGGETPYSSVLESGSYSVSVDSTYGTESRDVMVVSGQTTTVQVDWSSTEEVTVTEEITVEAPIVNLNVLQVMLIVVGGMLIVVGQRRKTH